MADFHGSPIKVENLKSKRSVEALDDPRPEKYRRMAGYNDYVRNVVINYLSMTSQDIAYRYLMPKANLQVATLDHDYLQRPYTEYWVDSALKVDETTIADIERKTRGQASNKQWFGERSWRLTASRFGDITRVTTRRNLDKLCKSLASLNFVETPAILHGKNYEKKAIRAFEAKMNIKTSPCGLFVSLSHPYLGATPDAIIKNGKELAIVEVKCPFVGRKMNIVAGKHFNFLKSESGTCTFNKGHRYYDQVQGQMYVSNIRKCYFVVFTFVDLFVEEVVFDEDYCKLALLPKLESFYNRHFRPYIASHM